MSVQAKIRRTVKEIPKVSEEQIAALKHAEEEQRFLSEKELRGSITAIRQTIKNEEVRLREKYKWLEHQNLLGMGCFVISVLAIVLVAYLYLKRLVHWSLAIPLIALPGSILHELEHDLIHNLYFKGKQWIQNVMFFVIWWVKMSIPPWYRKIIHLRHHIVSGQKEDIEERLIGLGLPLRMLRWLITFNPLASALIFDDLKKDNGEDFNKLKVTLLSAPTVIPFCVLLHLLICYVRLFLGLTFTSYDPALLLPMWLWPYVRDIAVILILPNVLRQACLNLIASYSHYYGDIPTKNVYYQNQIIDHWSMWPLQLFSFNFGATHVIHHYVPNQPFYLRQMLAPKATEELLNNGVRRNDFNIIFRKNRFYEPDQAIEAKRDSQEVLRSIENHDDE
jgi:fatty acid desaturase